MIELHMGTLLRGMAISLGLVAFAIGYTCLASAFHSAIWVDALHIFWWYGITEPFNHSGVYGRPDHTPTDFAVHAVIDALLVSFTISFLFARRLATLVHGWNATIRSEKHG